MVFKREFPHSIGTIEWGCLVWTGDGIASPSSATRQQPGSLDRPKIRPELRQLAKVVQPEATEVLEFLRLGPSHGVTHVDWLFSWENWGDHLDSWLLHGIFFGYHWDFCGFFHWMNAYFWRLTKMGNSLENQKGESHDQHWGVHRKVSYNRGFAENICLIFKSNGKTRTLGI